MVCTRSFSSTSGRVEDRVLTLWLQILLAGPDFEYGRFLHLETVTLGRGKQLTARFGEGHIKDFFALFDTFADELQGQGRLASSGFSLDEIEVPDGETTT